MRNLLLLLFTVFIFIGCESDELADELSATRSELAAANAKINSLQSTIGELVSQANQDELDLAAAKARIAALLGDIETLQSQIAELSADDPRLAELEAELENAINALQENQGQIADLDSEIAELTQSLVNADIDATTYLSTIAELENDLANAEAEVVVVTEVVTETVEVIQEVIVTEVVTETIVDEVVVNNDVIVTETVTVVVEVPVVETVVEYVDVIQTETVTEVVYVTETVTEVVTEYVEVIEQIEVEVIKVVTETQIQEVEVEVQCDFAISTATDVSSTTTLGEWSAWTPKSAAADIATITQTRSQDKTVTTKTVTTTSYELLDEGCEERDNDVESNSVDVVTTTKETRKIANPNYSLACTDTEFPDASKVLDGLSIDKSLDNDAVVGTYTQTRTVNCEEVSRNVKVWQYWSDSATFTESEGEVDYNEDGDQLDVYLMRSWYFAYQADGGKYQSTIDHQEYVLVTNNAPSCDKTEFTVISVSSYNFDTTKTDDYELASIAQSKTNTDCSKDTRTVKIIQEYELASSNNSESANNQDVNNDGDKLDTYKVEKWIISAFVDGVMLDGITKQKTVKTVTTNKCEETDHLTKDEIWKAAPLLDVDLDYGGNKNKVTYTFTSTATLSDCTIQKKSGFVQQTWLDVNETFNESDLDQDVNNDGDKYDVVTPRKHRLVIYLGGAAYGYSAWETAYYVSTDKTCTYTANTPVTVVGEWSDWVITDTDVTSDDYYVNAKRTKTTTKTTSYTKSFDDCADKADLVEVSTETETKSNHINPDFVVKTLGVISVNGQSGTFKNNITQKDWLYPVQVDNDDVIQIAIKGVKQDGNNGTENWDTNVSDLTVGSYVDIESKDGFTYSLMLTDGDYIYLQITVEDHTKTFTNFNAGFYPKN